MMKLLLASLLCLCALQPAAAQDVDPSDILRGGLQVVALIDQGNTGEVWDGAAPATKKRVTRNAFINQVDKARAPVGQAQQRIWVAINRQVVNDADPDLAGQYVSIDYETRFSANAAVTARELVSFHLDRDRVWRVSGYVLR